MEKNIYPLIKRLTTAHKMKLLFGMLKGIPLDRPRILEFGAGSGMATVRLLERFGGRATLIDYSPEAKFFFDDLEKDQLEIEYILGDLFALDLSGAYDIVFSDGLVEHFQGKKLDELISKHRQFLARDGHVLIIVPRHCFYILLRDRLIANDLFFNLVLKRLGISKPSYGYEKLYTQGELTELCRKGGLEVVRVRNTYKTVCILGRKIDDSAGATG
ncbi:MAG: class I SAM-dependent methyltransferase [Desulfobacterales bacterium]|nr:class I SAM-dependent methyltransferase [Desulfobacterales bacterium]